MIYTPKINGNEFDGYPLLPMHDNESGYYRVILEKIQTRMDYCLTHYGKTLLVRLLIRYPTLLKAGEDNRCFQYFIEEYRRALSSAGYRPHYLWAREQANAENCHYHLLLWLDGNRIRYFNNPTQANAIWRSSLLKFYGYDAPESGLIEVCHAEYSGVPMNHGILFSQEDESLTVEAFRLSSYLAKVHTKGSAPYHVREYGCSLINRE